MKKRIYNENFRCFKAREQIIGTTNKAFVQEYTHDDNLLESANVSQEKV